MVFQIVMGAIPLSVMWMILGDQLNIEGLIVGYAFGLATMYSLRGARLTITPRKLPRQLFWLVVYSLRMLWAVAASAFDVLRRVLNPRMPISPGIIPIATEDESNDIVISAASAHSITITPGELVVGFEDRDGQTYMLVHALDAESSRKTLVRDQRNRLKMFNRILGK